MLLQVAGTLRFDGLQALLGLSQLRASRRRRRLSHTLAQRLPLAGEVVDAGCSPAPGNSSRRVEVVAS